VFSILFYAWGEPSFVFLLLGSIVGNHILGLKIGFSSVRLRKLYLIIGVSLNLLLIAYYKYAIFFVNSLFLAFHKFGFNFNVKLPDISLPLGISFFTFQAISYLVDVYRGDVKPAKRFSDVALYISMFPQLIAGPIVRYKTISSEIQKRYISFEDVSVGIRIFLVGMGQKVLIANNVAIAADEIFSLRVADLNILISWFGVICYSLQIYFDFSGYSNMAIGLGRMMGFTYPQNFNYPYISKSITEFWRRWHISLSSWFRDYLYISLGGNRKGPIRTYFNLFIVFFLCGLWHGASFTFVVWGLFHGCILVIERLGVSKLLTKIPVLAQYTYALFFTAIGWCLFRAESLGHAFGFIKAMFGLQISSADLSVLQFARPQVLVFFILGLIFSIPIVPFLERYFEKQKEGWFRRSATWVYMSVYVVCSLIILLMLSGNTYNPFIYFRF
tara:strand:+ start:73988 stop:75316 length:1329 start_codon:yes stop_codon:yes gene_type:complete